MHEIALALALLCAPQEAADPATVAIENFKGLPEADQSAIVAEIVAKVEACEDVETRKLLALRDRAKRELPVKPEEPVKFFEHSEYAPAQPARSFVDPESADGTEQYQYMRAWQNASPFWSRIRYDFAADCGRDAGADPLPHQRMNDLLLGCVPGHDVLIAWLEWKLDCRDAFNPVADYFSHAYCDLVGNCWSNVTIYDALASQNNVDKADIDVIAYARIIMKSNKFVSPIPANKARSDLYESINKSFLDYFRHRSAVEEFAWAFVNPDVALREEHADMNEWAATLFAKYPTLDAAIGEWKKCKDREDFFKRGEGWRKDSKIVEAATEWRVKRNAQRWVVNGLAVEVLKARLLWPEEAPQAPKSGDGNGGG